MTDKPLRQPELDPPKFLADAAGLIPVGEAVARNLDAILDQPSGMDRIMGEEQHVRDGLAAGVITQGELRERMDGLMDQGHAIGVIRQRELAADRQFEAGAWESVGPADQPERDLGPEELAATIHNPAWEDYERAVAGLDREGVEMEPDYGPF